MWCILRLNGRSVETRATSLKVYFISLGCDVKGQQSHWNWNSEGTDISYHREAGVFDWDWAYSVVRLPASPDIMTSVKPEYKPEEGSVLHGQSLEKNAAEN